LPLGEKFSFERGRQIRVPL